MRLASIPAISAASGLDPTAKNCRAGRRRVSARCTSTTTISEATKPARNSIAPTENTGMFGKSTSHAGKLSEVIDLASEYSTRKDRNKAMLASVTMIDGTRA